MKCYGKACIIIEAFMCTSLYLTHDNLWHCMLKLSRPPLFFKINRQQINENCPTLIPASVQEYFPVLIVLIAAVWTKQLL